jgi:hypothetical protein
MADPGSGTSRQVSGPWSIINGREGTRRVKKGIVLVTREIFDYLIATTTRPG